MGGGGGGELLTCPYPLKVQARPPQDQRSVLRSKVSGQTGLEGGGETFYVSISTEGPGTPITRTKTGFPI